VHNRYLPFSFAYGSRRPCGCHRSCSVCTQFLLARNNLCRCPRKRGYEQFLCVSTRRRWHSNPLRLHVHACAHLAYQCHNFRTYCASAAHSGFVSAFPLLFISFQSFLSALFRFKARSSYPTCLTFPLPRPRFPRYAAVSKPCLCFQDFTSTTYCTIMFPSC